MEKPHIFGAFCQGMLGLERFANSWVFRIRPLEVKLLAGKSISQLARLEACLSPGGGALRGRLLRGEAQGESGRARDGDSESPDGSKPL